MKDASRNPGRHLLSEIVVAGGYFYGTVGAAALGVIVPCTRARRVREASVSILQVPPVGADRGFSIGESTAFAQLISRVDGATTAGVATLTTAAGLAAAGVGPGCLVAIRSGNDQGVFEVIRCTNTVMTLRTFPGRAAWVATTTAVALTFIVVRPKGVRMRAFAVTTGVEIAADTDVTAVTFHTAFVGDP